jgi:glucokinase
VLESSKSARVVGVDVGGTTVKAALVSGDLEIIRHDEVPTPLEDPVALLDAIAGLVERVAGGEATGVGYGLPSLIDQRQGRVADSVNVPIADIRFLDEMRRRLDLPSAMDNDTNAACLAEARAGAARGAEHVVMLTLGTGVGGGLLLDGRLYRGATGFAGELGHTSVDEDGPPCRGHCPNRGCLEVIASAGGLVRAAREVAAGNPQGRVAALLAAGKEPSARRIIDGGLAGDGDCVAALERVGRHLGVGIASFVNIFNPEVVVVGGGLISAGDLILGPAADEAAARALRPSWEQTRLAAAELGNDAGLIGAAALVLEDGRAEP